MSTTRRPKQVDLIGRVRRHRRTLPELLIDDRDAARRAGCIRRWKWVKARLPKRRGLMMPPDSYLVMTEARYAFIDGHYVATILLSCALIEHRLADILTSHGYGDEAKRGLSATVKALKKHKLADPYVAEQIDRLRLRRNPFAHAKEQLHPHSVHEIARANDEHFLKTLEDTAQNGLALMYEVLFGNSVQR